PASSSAPRTALQPQESVGAGAGEAALSLPGLLFGAPALLGLALVLALVLVGLVSWRRRQRRLRGASFAEAPDGDKDKDAPEPLDKVIILSPGISDAAAPAWPPPGEDPGTTPPGHSVPVPATELGSTELVTTKTAGPEQQ
uniref:TNF receptor superfamily member 13C n=1 Tax=Rhinopithecus bieti TaxID=61621 RepID=A0A2K6JRP1_RHIBE